MQTIMAQNSDQIVPYLSISQDQCENFSQTKIDTSENCGKYTGDINFDRNVCQARNCCFNEQTYLAIDNGKTIKKMGITGKPAWPRWQNSFANSKSGKFSRNFWWQGRRKRRQAVDQTQEKPETCQYDNKFDKIWDFPSLADKYESCCSQNFCYKPKLPAKYRNWSEWSQCSSCDEKIFRSRECYHSQTNNLLSANFCEGISYETKECDLKQCQVKSLPIPIVYESWSDWTQCSKKCGKKGIRSRQRICLFNDGMKAECQSGLSNESQTCYQKIDASCDTSQFYTPWTEWSGCQGSCPEWSARMRYRKCNNHNFCKPNQVFHQEDDCCAKGQWSKFTKSGSCQTLEKCGEGMQMLTRTCLSGKCEGVKTTYQPCKVECITNTQTSSQSSQSNLSSVPNSSEWSEWSTCNATCGLGQQSRSRDRKGLVTEYKNCQVKKDCAEYSDWNIGACSATCGIGTRKDVRECIGTGKCLGPSFRIEKCEQSACPSDNGGKSSSSSTGSLSSFFNLNPRELPASTTKVIKSWSTLDQTNGPGQDDFSIQAHPDIQPNWEKWSTWSICKTHNYFCPGKKCKTRQRSCIMNKYKIDSKKCGEGKSYDIEICQEGTKLIKSTNFFSWFGTFG